MKEDIKNSLKIAFITLSFIVGAGFTSGQEVFNFFAKKGNFCSLIFAITLITFNTYVVLKKVNDDEKIQSFDDYVIACSSKFIGRLFNFFSIVLAFLCFFGMFSAIGSTFEESFHTNFWFGVATMAISCFLVFIAEAKGVLAVSTLIGPFKVIGITLLCILAVKNSNLSLLKDTQFVGESVLPKNLGLFASSLSAGLCYVGFNMGEAGAVFVPLRKIMTKNSVKLGSILGGIFVGLIVTTMWIAIRLNLTELATVQIPMWVLVDKMPPIFKVVYLVLLMSGAFTTAVAMGFAMLSQIKTETKAMKNLSALILCLIGVAFSKIKFGVIVSKGFLVLGYISLFWMFVIFYDFFKSIYKKKASSEGSV